MNQIPVCPVEVNGRLVRDRRLLMTKLAAVSPSEAGYEATLAKLGLHVLQDRVTDLMPYFRGFQLLELSEDGEFAGGFFVFDANGTVIDAPMFLIKGRLKGKELLFLRDRQAFIPSQDGLIKYVLSLRDQTLGRPGPGERDRRPGNRGTPNIDVFSQANRFMQKVSAYPPVATPWGREAKVFDSYLSTHIHPKTAAVLSSIVKTRKLPKPPIEQFLHYPGVAEKLATWCEISPKLAQRVKQSLGNNWMQKVAEKRKQTKELLTPNRKLTLTSSNGLKLQSKTASRPVDLVGMSASVPGFLSGALREAAAEEYAEFGTYFTDRRAVSTTKIAMDMNFEDNAFSGPAESGPAMVPTRSGTSKKCLVILSKDQIQTDGYASKGETLVLAADGGGAVRCVSSDLAVKLDVNVQEPVAELQDWKDKLESAGSLSFADGDIFVLFDKYGRATQPLRSQGGNSEGELDVRPASLKKSGLTPEGNSYGQPYCMCLDSSGSVRKIRKSTRGNTFSYLESDEGTILLVPESAKVLKIDTEKEEYSSYKNPKSIDLLPFSQMTEEHIQKMAGFTLSVGEGSCKLNGKEIATKAAIFSLMRDFGLHKTAAIGLVRDRENKASVQKYAVLPASEQIEKWQLFTDVGRKLAYDSRPPSEPPYSFSMPEQARGRSNSVIPVEEQYPTSSVERSPMQYANTQDPEWSGYSAPYEEPVETQNPNQNTETAREMANRPEALWENDLFASLMRNVRLDSQVSRQVEALFSMVDTTGRTLFLMYSHQDAFEDAFGEKDLPQLEEQLLSTFEAGGDLITDFLQRNIDAAGDGILMSIESN